MASQPKYGQAQRTQMQRSAGRIVASTEKGTAAQKAASKRSADQLVSNSMQSVNVKAHARSVPGGAIPTVGKVQGSAQVRASKVNSSVSALGFGNYTPPPSHTHSG